MANKINPTRPVTEFEFIPAHEANTTVKENETWNNLHSPSWCPVPFNTISWHPTGMITRCMMSDEDMGETHESNLMQELRQGMLDGKWDKRGCMNCLQKEKVGAKSQRMNWLTHLKRGELGDPEPYTNPKLTGNTISHLFVNFSNTCNFKCRMCNANYSNSLIPENKHMAPLFPRSYKPTNERREKNFNNINEFLEANPEVLKDIRQIWMTGGEPFMDDSPYKLMELIEKYGHPEKIRMTITTNGSKLDFNRLDEFKKLKRLSIDISIDSTGPMFEYMRSNGVFTWDQMKETVDTLKEFKDLYPDWFHVQINASYQIFNYNNIYDFVQFIADRGFASNIRLLMYPKHFRVGNLPDNLKEEAFTILDKCEQKFNTEHYEDLQLRSMLDDLRAALREDISNDELGIDYFKKIVKEQDKFRGKYLYEYNKKLGEIVYGQEHNKL
jgi:MoaA/NifB/PqqE/SkfB family radical SAM enzyme